MDIKHTVFVFVVVFVKVLLEKNLLLKYRLWHTSVLLKHLNTAGH